MKGDVETVRHKGQWVNRIQGRYALESDAILVRRRIALVHARLETVRVRGKWVNQIDHSYPTQTEAAAYGRLIARILHVEWFLKSRLGRVRERNSYGSDPHETEG